MIIYNRQPLSKSSIRKNGTLLIKSKIDFKKPLDTPNAAESIFRYLWDINSLNEQEEIYVIFVDRALKFIAHKLLFKGGTSTCNIDLRILFRQALLNNATGLILAHNHPSGNLIPSKADIKTTANITQLSEALGIRFLDHLILANQGYYSFSNAGLL